MASTPGPRKRHRIRAALAMIRPLHPTDAEHLYGLFRKPTVLTCGHFDPAAGLEDFRTFTDRPEGEQYRLVIEEEGRLLGLGVLNHPPFPRVAHLGEISLLLPAETQDPYPGPKLLQALIELAENWLNLKRLETTVPVVAPAVVQTFRSLGFVEEGVMKKSLADAGALHDEITLARLSGFEGQSHREAIPARSPTSRRGSGHEQRALIRPMDEADIEDLYEVFRAPENCRTTLQLPSQELWLTRERILEPPSNMRRLVAVINGHVIGMISLNLRPEPCRAHMGGIGMMILPAYWGQGIGTQLMQEMLTLADNELNLKRVVLVVHADNPAGIRLYEKHGFIVEGTKYFHTYGDGGWADSLFMARITE